jgi:hypothetical protein
VAANWHPNVAKIEFKPQAMFYTPVVTSAVIRVYDDVGNVIEKQEHAGDFKEW